MRHLLLVGAGGGLGAMLRFLAGGFVHRFLPASFPYGTFLINVSGCFGIGFLAGLVEERFLLGPGARLFWMVGVLGGYTTFSTFGYETLVLLRGGSQAAALANAAGQVVLGLTAVAAGTVAARVLP